MVQTLERVPDWTFSEPFVEIAVASIGSGATVLFLMNERSVLRVVFHEIHAMSVHDEFAHPSLEERDEYPRLDGAIGAFPLLRVRESRWIESFSDLRLQVFGEIPEHYLFISMNLWVDVLSYSPPKIEWSTKEAFEKLFSGIAHSEFSD